MVRHGNTKVGISERSVNERVEMESVEVWSSEASGAFTTWRDTLLLSKYKSGTFAWSVYSIALDDPGRGTAWRSRKFRKGGDALLQLREGHSYLESAHAEFGMAHLIKAIPVIGVLDTKLAEEFAEAVANEITDLLLSKV